ncbi:MAG: hypothetical protein IPO77_15385 [Acidobacteria bacterium]|nr:hypothetical protein [Acidobacteriota bacterium]
MLSIKTLKTVLAILLISVVNVSVRAQQGEAKIPDTPAGKVFGEFMKAFNTGDSVTLRKFHKDHGGDENNADQDLEAFKQTGPLKFHSVKSSNDFEIEALVQAKNDGQWLNFYISIDDKLPYPINNIRVQPTSAPGQ